MKLRPKTILLLLVASVICAVSYYHISAHISTLYGYHEWHYTLEKYEANRTKIQVKRGQLKKEQQASNRQTARVFRAALMEDIFPFWYGTQYDFYGISQTPGQGEIACGYFVTTSLEHIGVKLKRVALAQMASEKMIKQLVSPKNISRFSNKTLGEVLDFVGDAGARHQSPGVVWRRQ